MAHEIPGRATRTDIVIRPSSLTSYPDCGLRTAASAYPDLFAAAGYDLRPRQQSAAAAVGTAVHAGAAFTLKSKVDTGDAGADDDAEECAIEGFRHEIAGGATWDDATPRPNDGEKQVRRMVAEYRRTVAPKIVPLMVEKRLEADLGDGYTLSGQADSLAILPEAVRDLKTGTERIHIPQLGAYAILVRSQPNGQNVERVVEDFIPRVKASYAQPHAIEIEYPVQFAEEVAFRRIQDLKRDLMEFAISGDTLAFPANPMSILCSPKFCPAHGTNACRQHKGAFTKDDR
jgi:hypothetical protein